MKERNLFEDLVAVSPGMEIWWDSSPVIFSNWVQEDARQGRRAATAPTWSASSRACTTSATPWTSCSAASPPTRRCRWPPSRTTRARWQKVADKVMAANPGLDTEGLFWLLYKEVVKSGSDMFLPLFEASGYKEGFLSGQVDPRSAFDGEAMLAQALEIHAVNPNVMVKVPGTAEGYEVIEELTSRGIATNNTLTFVLSQLLDCAKSVMRGLEKAKANGVDLSKWRSVITHMEARYGDLGGLREAGAEVGVEVTEGDVRYAELAIFKKAYRTLKERDYQSKMLSCSLRLGPTVDGVQRVWHLEEKAGADIVVTCPPSFIDEVINFPSADAHQVQAEPDRRRPAGRRHGEAHEDRVLRARLRRGRLHPRGVQHAPGAREDARGVLQGHQRDGRVRRQLPQGQRASPRPPADGQ